MFCILMLLLYWIQNLTHASWEWIGFIKPFLDFLLTEANKIYSVSFDLWGAVFELKYLSALIILVVAAFVFKALGFLVCALEGLYRGTRMLCKKTEETLFNNRMQSESEKNELKLTKYNVLIKTQIKKKFSHQELAINIEEQNKIMNDFIQTKTSVSPMQFSGAFLYQFNNFSNIDMVLDVLFKLINSSAPLDYNIAIQVGDNFKQLGKLLELENWGKVAIAADTAYRYKFNTTHRYEVSQIGLFQHGDSTLEVHEFKPIL
ncbi:hypothetical protein IKQ21_06040 [bacterium]|nr:hypothetical protein [bacterium]